MDEETWDTLLRGLTELRNAEFRPSDAELDKAVDWLMEQYGSWD